LVDNYTSTSISYSLVENYGLIEDRGWSIIMIKKIIITTAIIVVAIIMLTQTALAFDVTADTLQCGGDGCYDMGYAAGRIVSNHGIECPSGHSIAYCVGWDSGAGVDNRYLFTKSEYCQCT
jgi:hypothetical protein